MSRPIRCHLYPTEAAALRAARVIGLALGATEVLTRGGVPSVVARKTWAVPFQLLSGVNAGQWAVPWKYRLIAIEGQQVDDSGTPRTVPLDSTCVAVSAAEREP